MIFVSRKIDRSRNDVVFPVLQIWGRHVFLIAAGKPLVSAELLKLNTSANSTKASILRNYKKKKISHFGLFKKIFVFVLKTIIVYARLNDAVVYTWMGTYLKISNQYNIRRLNMDNFFLKKPVCLKKLRVYFFFFLILNLR